MTGRACRVLALVALMLAVAAPADAKLKVPSAGKALTALERKTRALPSAATTKANKRKLVRLAVSARRAAKRRPCLTVQRLAQYRRLVGRTKVKKRQRRAAGRVAALGAASMDTSRALLASRRTRRCGGGVKPSTVETPNFRVLKSDANGMRLRVQLPALRFAPAQGGGRTWTELMLRESDAFGKVGAPGIPAVGNVFGVPEGAKVAVKAGRVSSYTLQGVDVLPTQRDPVDKAPLLPDRTESRYKTGAFKIDRKAYRARGKAPAKAAAGKILGRSRDIVLGNIVVPAARYDAARKSLEVLNSVDVTITFSGGGHQFSDQLDSPWERPQRRLRDALLNAGVVRADRPIFLERCGEEMLVITNPSTLAAADQFANAKRAQGMRTSVVQVGAGPGQIGTTPAQIQSFIRERLTAKGCIHPSYVTLMGDDELVPTFPGLDGVESDLEYSLLGGKDEFADVALGRIVGDDAAGVTDAVTKIVNYENGPPGGPWLQRATIAAEFQDDEVPNQAEDRTFILFGETARNGILNTPLSLPQQVDRIYATYPIGAVDPLQYRDGTPLPAQLLKPAFAWDGDTADIRTAWNDGRYLMIHRDHGGTHAWDNPRFSSEDADALTNGAELPVVLSINCSSGAFQDDDRSFATQALVNPNGGAAGVFGDTEVSPTDHNTQLGLGFLDALLPRVLGGEGPAARQRMGHALMYGKTRLAAIWPPSGPGITGGDGNTRREFYLWHYYGDPSMQMWGGEPVPIPDLKGFTARFTREFVPGGPVPDPPPYAVNVTLPAEFNGQAISLLREGQVIGKAIVSGGQAQIPTNFGDGQPPPGGLQVAMEADGHRPVSVPVDRLSTSCPSSPRSPNEPMTTTGTLEPARAGASIVVRYTPPGGQPFERTVQTDAKGSWSDTIFPGQYPPGQWRIEPRFDGDATHPALQGDACTVTVA